MITYYGLLETKTLLTVSGDPWISNCGTLIKQIPANSNINMNCSLKEITTMDGSWNLYLFHFWVSKEVISRIVSVPPPHLASGLDKIIWGVFSTGFFSLRNGYEKVCEGSLNPKEPI